MPLDLVDKLIIAQKFDISAWLVPTLNALVRRAEMIDMSEANRLGMDWVLKLAKVRETARETVATRPTSSLRTCTNCHYTGLPQCNNCGNTANCCGSCRNYLPETVTQSVPGAGTKGDYTKEICKIFGLQ